MPIMKRLLIVSPNFLPNTAADMHRVRLMVPYASEFGWQVEILCVDPADNESPRDDALLERLPDQVLIHRVRARKSWHHRVLRMNGLSRRAIRPIAEAGAALLEKKKFHLAYFSSTAFSTFRIGYQWRHRYGLQYVLDYQDPWVNDYYRRTSQLPPGGRLRHELEQLEARLSEPKCIEAASGITSVSPSYVDQLAERYSAIPPSIILPFPVDDEPWIAQLPVKYGLWTSVGRGGADLGPAAKALFCALINARRIKGVQHLLPRQLRFVGTSYASKGTGSKSIQPIAESLACQGVLESTDRVSLQEARLLQQESERLIVLLSNDPAYRPSKLAGLIRSGKPIVVVAHAEHWVHRHLANIEGVTLLLADDGERDQSARLLEPSGAMAPKWPTDILDEFSASLHAKRIFAFFDEIVVKS